MQWGAQGENEHGKRCTLEKMKMEALGVPPRSLCVAGSTEDRIAGLRAARHIIWRCLEKVTTSAPTIFRPNARSEKLSHDSAAATLRTR